MVNGHETWASMDFRVSFEHPPAAFQPRRHANIVRAIGICLRGPKQKPKQGPEAQRLAQAIERGRPQQWAVKTTTS
jgi:hypothetical protein